MAARCVGVYECALTMESSLVEGGFKMKGLNHGISNPRCRDPFPR